MDGALDFKTMASLLSLNDFEVLWQDDENAQEMLKKLAAPEGVLTCAKEGAEKLNISLAGFLRLVSFLESKTLIKQPAGSEESEEHAEALSVSQQVLDLVKQPQGWLQLLEHLDAKHASGAWSR